jgi:dTDP-glucose 4,6-dehydratase
MLESIIQGTTRTLDFAVFAGVKRFLFVSSGAVYGKQPPEMTHIPESYTGAPDTMDPASAYGEGKRVGELLCSIFSKEQGIETVVARCFAFVGPHLPLDAHFAIGNFIRDAMAGKPIQIKGDGTPYRSYLYAADLAIWLWTMLFSGTPGQSYNVGSAQDIPLSQLAAEVSNVLLPNTQLDLGSIPSSASISRYVPDTRFVEKFMNNKPKVSLREAIRRTAAWSI